MTARRALCTLWLLSGLAWLAACGAPASSGAPEVAPPLVVTVVVTATGRPPQSSAAATPGVTSVPAYPPPFQTTVGAVYQPFERGFMIYLSDRQVVWVFLRPSLLVGADGSVSAVRPNYGRWLAFNDTFRDGDPETDPSMVAPAGFVQPKRGFGKVWREQEGLRADIGWALDFERPYAAAVADYSIGAFDSDGTYVPGSFIHTVTALDGATLHVDEASGVWSQP